MARAARKDVNFTSFILKFINKVTWCKIEEIWQVKLIV